jgi:hypothetical protein
MNATDKSDAENYRLGTETHIDTGNTAIDPLCKHAQLGDSFIYVHPNDLHRLLPGITCAECIALAMSDEPPAFLPSGAVRRA